MKLSKKEREYLAIIHKIRLVNKKPLEEYAQLIGKYFSFTDDELHKKIKNFLDRGLIDEIKIKENDVMYFVKPDFQELMDKKLEQNLKEEHKKRTIRGYRP